MSRDNPELVIRLLRPVDFRRLRLFLRALEHSGESAHFHPHPFDLAHLRKMLISCKKDVYAAVLQGGCVVAYGMLRGWDEGFEVPSLGMAVHPQFRRIGLGRLLMHYLDTVSRTRGATRIRLKVYPKNRGALSLYRSLGYKFLSREQGQHVGFLELGTPQKISTRRS